LALDCNEPRKAEQLVAKALSMDPPQEIAEELRDLYEQINFRRHLVLRGLTLDEDEMQINLSGKSVGFGIVESEEFLQRVTTASKIIYRIAERRQNRPFRERGRLKETLKSDYEVFVSVPRAASFSITLKLGRPIAQQKLPGILNTEEIVDEFMDLMELTNQANIKEVNARIPDPAYFRNFMALAKKIAPDGNEIGQVGFTAIRGGHARIVQVTTPRQGLAAIQKREMTDASELVKATGVLRFADATRGQSGLIKIVDETRNETYTVKVPEGMMHDIVRPMWDMLVTVIGHQKGRIIMLEDIQEEV